MTIHNDKEYKAVDERIEKLIAKGTGLGDMELLSEEDKKELKTLSDAAYDWESETDPHPGTVNVSLISAIENALKKLGLTRTEAARAVDMSTDSFNELLKGDRGITYSEAKNIYHNLNVPANIVLS